MYDKDRIITDILTAIEQEKLVLFTDISAFVAPSLSTLYEWELDKSETIKSALDKNKVQIKLKMRRNWQSNDNPTLQIAAFKLLANDDELQKLSTSYNKNEHSGEMGITWNEVKNYGTK